MFLNYLGEIYYWLLKPLLVIGLYPYKIIFDLHRKTNGIFDDKITINLLQVSTLILLWEVANFLTKKLKTLNLKNKLRRFLVMTQLAVVILLSGISLLFLLFTNLPPSFRSLIDGVIAPAPILVYFFLTQSLSIASYFFFTLFVGMANTLRYVLMGVGRLIGLSTKIKLGSRMKKFWKLFLVILAIWPIISILSALLWFHTDADRIRAQEFFTLHAAIKNTCLLDENKINCPQTLQEIKYIEPEELAKAEACCQMNYQYDPKTNQYTFIVRYSPLNAVVFDQRLIDQYGIDLKEFSVDINFLKSDRLKNPPVWIGPWDLPDWKYFE